MDDSIILVLGGLGIFALWKSGILGAAGDVAKETAGVIGGVGTATQGLGQGVGTVGVELGESFKSFTDLQQELVNKFTDALRGGRSPTQAPNIPSTYTTPTVDYNGKPSTITFNASSPLFPTAQAQIAANMQSVNDSILAQSNIKTEYILRGGQLVAIPFGSQVTQAERTATDNYAVKMLNKAPSPAPTVTTVSVPVTNLAAPGYVKSTLQATKKKTGGLIKPPYVR